MEESISRLYGGQWSIDNGVDIPLNDPRLRQITAIRGRVWKDSFEIVSCHGLMIDNGEEVMVRVGLRGRFSTKSPVFRKQLVELGRKNGVYVKALGLLDIRPQMAGKK